MASYTTFSLFTYPRRYYLQAFLQMGLAGRHIAGSRGLRFFKLVGSGGGNGFSLVPDFSRYGLLAVWERPEDARHFFDTSPIMQRFRRRSTEHLRLEMLPFQAHGSWAGKNPFEHTVAAPDSGRVVILTRAHIRWSRLVRFWRQVPAAGRALDAAPGLICSFGVGEAPLLLQGTISIWQSLEHAKQFAYQQGVHREIVHKTRRENWYRQDLFARFVLVKVEGRMAGKTPG